MSNVFFYWQFGRKHDNASWIGNAKPGVRRSQLKTKIMVCF